MPLLVFIIFVIFGIAFRAGTLADPDTGWHIAAGDLIREIGRLPQTDPWSYTAGDARWYNISWAYDVALSVVHEFGGLPAVAALTIVLYALALAFVAWLAVKSSGSVIAGLLVAVLSGFVLLPGMLARPQTVTFLLIAAVYALLRFGKPRALWLLPIVMIAWANVHGGFLTAFVIMGAFFVEALVARDFARAARLTLIGGLGAGALMLNPYGYEIATAALLTLGSVMRNVLAEWRPATLGMNAQTLFLIALLGVSALYDRRIPLADKMLAVFWIVMGLLSARMMQVAAILAAPYLAQGFALRLRALPFGEALAKRDASYAADLGKAPARAVLGAAAAVMAAACFAPAVQNAIAGGRPFVGFPAATAPDGALDFLAANYPGIRLYNEYGMGGYMIYRERGAVKVFADGRADTAFPRDVLRDAIALGYMGRSEGPDEGEWEALVDRHRVEAFLLSRRMRLYRMLAVSPRWTRAFEDEGAALFVRADLVRR